MLELCVLTAQQLLELMRSAFGFLLFAPGLFSLPVLAVTTLWDVKTLSGPPKCSLMQKGSRLGRFPPFSPQNDLGPEEVDSSPILDTPECRVVFEKILMSRGQSLTFVRRKGLLAPKTTHYLFTFSDGIFLLPRLKLW